MGPFAVVFSLGISLFICVFADAIKNRKTMAKKDFIYAMCLSVFSGGFAIFSIYAFFASPKDATFYEALDFIFNKLGK